MNLLTALFCWIYGVSLYLYPADFRQRFGREMELVFRDRCRTEVQTHGFGGLIRFAFSSGPDWLLSLAHEHVARDVISPQVAEGLPVFYVFPDEIPNRSSLLNGGLLAIAFFAFVIFLITHGGSRQIFLMGSHHPSRSHLLALQTGAEATDLASEVTAKPYPDQPPPSPYFRSMPVLSALDADGDNIISAQELAEAIWSLARLDRNHDGHLSAAECGGPRADGKTALRFMRFHPVLDVLDSDHDGIISKAEIENATASLRKLDRNGDGTLTEDELLPSDKP
jgi:hypothetical protein